MRIAKTRSRRALTLDHLQQREEHWAIVDLVGKAGHVQTVPVPDWVKRELDEWLTAAAIGRGKLFRRVNKVGKTWGDGMTEKKSTRRRRHGETRLFVASVCRSLAFAGDFTSVRNKGQQTTRSRS